MCALRYAETMSTSTPAFLSVRLPEATRDRLKALAAARGETVQDLVGSLVERFLIEEDRKPPALGAVRSKLRAHAPALISRGVTGLWVFGSVARGDARVDSDIDLFAEFDPGAPLSLIGLASLRAELSALLGTTADLVERSALRPTAREAAERDAVRVL
jgi:predicted nucleotidyltransferase